MQDPLPWLMEAPFRARSPIVDLMPRLRETALGEQFAVLNSEHD